MFVYMAVTADKYELPLAIADSPKQLAKLVGTTPAKISSAIGKNINGKYLGLKYVKVWIDYNEEDDEIWEISQTVENE